MPAARRLPPFPRALGILFCCVAFLTILGGGSTCKWSSNHHDDDDFDDDDDDSNLSVPNDGTAGGGHGGLVPSPGAILQGLAARGDGILLSGRHAAGPAGHHLVSPVLDGESVLLTDYVIDLDPRPGHHPIARLRDIRGLSVAGFDELGVMDADDFSAFSERVLAANDELLGLPEAAGRLHPRSVHFLDEVVIVVHQQVRPGSPARVDWDTSISGTLQGSEMLFVFDLLGRLLQIENRTTLPPGVVVSLPEGTLPTR